MTKGDLNQILEHIGIALDDEIPIFVETLDGYEHTTISLEYKIDNLYGARLVLKAGEPLGRAVAREGK